MQMQQQIVLAGRPQGMPGPEHFTLREGPVAEVGEGQLLLRNVAMAFDAYLPEQQRGGGRMFSSTI